jgi:uncharacterized protein YkwD
MATDPYVSSTGSAFDAGGQATLLEQHILDLINAARANPAAEAARLGIDLNEGLAPGTISAAAKAPLVFDTHLNEAADAHSAWMLDTDNFSHTGADGNSPQDRMAAAGYVFQGHWEAGENIAAAWGNGVALDQAVADKLERDLFLSPEHRVNLLNPDFHEIGIGLQHGDYHGSPAVFLTEDFAVSDAAQRAPAPTPTPPPPPPPPPPPVVDAGPVPTPTPAPTPDAGSAPAPAPVPAPEPAPFPEPTPSPATTRASEPAPTPDPMDSGGWHGWHGWHRGGWHHLDFGHHVDPPGHGIAEAIIAATRDYWHG